MVQLGQKAKDTITGFAGTVTGHARYLSGCDQYLLSPPVKAYGSPTDACWYDEQRLVVTDDTAIVLDNSRGTGADKPAPMK